MGMFDAKPIITRNENIESPEKKESGLFCMIFLIVFFSVIVFVIYCNNTTNVGQTVLNTNTNTEQSVFGINTVEVQKQTEYDAKIEKLKREHNQIIDDLIEDYYAKKNAPYVRIVK